MTASTNLEGVKQILFNIGVVYSEVCMLPVYLVYLRAYGILY